MRNDFSTAIFCGGNSTRMGQDKASLMIGGVTFLEKLCLEFSPCSQVYLSVGTKKGMYHRPDTIEITDLYPACGPLGGLHAVLQSAMTDWVFVTGCDMPYMSLSFAKYLFAQKESFSRDIKAIIPQSRNKCHPLAGFYHKDLLPLITSQLNKGCYRMMTFLEAAGAAFVPISDSIYEPCLENINTPAGYASIQNNPMPVIAFSGYSGSGKTTLLCKLIPLLRDQGIHIAVVKHTHHALHTCCESEVSDTALLRKAGADLVILSDTYSADSIESISEQVQLQQQQNDADPVDLLLLEGFKQLNVPAFWLTGSEKPLFCPIPDKRLLGVISWNTETETILNRITCSLHQENI